MGSRDQGAVGPGKDQFADTGETIEVAKDGKVTRYVVLKFRDRFYAGELLTLLNPHGFGGAVWSGSTLERLEYNANFRGPGGHSH